MACEQNVRGVFEEYDKDNSGYVTLDEAQRVLKEHLGYSENNTKRLLKKFDVNEDNKLCYDEFVKFYEVVQKRREDIVRVFKEYDADKSGTLSMEEVRNLLKENELSDEEIQELFKSCDSNEDGQLNLAEFCELWSN